MSDEAKELTHVPAGEPQSLAAAVLRAANDPNMDPGRLREFLAVAKDAEEMQLRREERMAEREYNIAWAQLMPKMPTISKNGLIEYKPGSRPTQFAKWDDIHVACMPLLYEHGFAVSFDSQTADGKLTVFLIISHSGGHKEVRHFSVQAQDTGGSKSPAQASASAYTLAQRHAFCKAFNILTRDMDDDGSEKGTPEMVPEKAVMELEDMLATAEEKVPGTRKRLMEHVRQTYRADALSTLTVEQAKTVKAQLSKKLGAA